MDKIANEFTTGIAIFRLQKSGASLNTAIIKKGMYIKLYFVPYRPPVFRYFRALPYAIEIPLNKTHA